MVLESGEASPPYHVAIISLFWYNFVCVLTKRDMKLKIGQKAFHFSFVDSCG